MKTLPTAIATGHSTAQCALAAAALFLGACSATTGSLKNATERHGQVQFSSGKEQIVGEIAIRHTDEDFQATITKGPGVPLLTISAKFAIDSKSKETKERQMVSSHVGGALSHGGLTYRPKDVAKKSAANLASTTYAWAALPEVFMWGEADAKGGESVRVTLPDLAMHARATNGQVKNFDYSRHQNPTGQPLPLRDLKKQPTLEKVICHLD